MAGIMPGPSSSSGTVFATLSEVEWIGGGAGSSGGAATPSIGYSGGAGERLYETNFDIVSGVVYDVYVGKGGRGGGTTSATAGFGENGENGEATAALGKAVNGGGAGAGNFSPGGSGTATQIGFDGGSGGGGPVSGGVSDKFNTTGQGNNGSNSTGGGAGSAASGITPGAGVSSSITGTPTTVAAGGAYGTGAAPIDGTGNGGASNAAGLPGLSGARGRFVARFPTADYTLTATGSFSTATDGSDTVVTFSGRGTFRLDV